MGLPSELPPDTLLGGKFRLLHRIGRGGMGDVWVARNEATQAEVAVKTLARAERTNVNDERFRREARLAATMAHRNVVRIFDLVEDPDGTLGLVMELLRGGTLEACLHERGTLSALQAVAVAAPILSALHHVHQKGIIHRDVKPANIFFAVEPDGHVIPKILDFGIAKLPAAGSALTLDGSVLGTPHYMSPEHIRGQEDLDGRSDMFSLAVVLYEMLTGVRVFQRDSAAGSLAAVLEHEVDPDPSIEPKLWIALTRALAKRPYERYASCAEFAESLRSALGATDEELVESLQELRPQTVGIPEPVGTEHLSAASFSARRRVAGARRTRLLWALGGAAVAMTATGVMLIATTRSSAGTARADDRHAPPAEPASAAVAPRDVIPPPPPPPIELGDLGPAPSSSARTSARPPATAQPTRATAPTARPSGTASPGGKGSKRDPATRPDF